jgi:rhodanese-related sulfurtransferase
MESTIVIVAADAESVDQAVTRLARVGLESVAGYLEDGMYGWDQAGLATATVAQMPADELKARIDEHADLRVVDVRRPTEYAAGHVPGATNIPLAELARRIGELEAARPTAVVCASGFRSSAATSVLEQRGFPEVYNLVGGTNGWVASGFPVESETAAGGSN